MNEFFSLFLRTLIVYFFILLMMRVMGQRELGKLTVFDLVITMMIADVSSLAIEETDKPVWHALIPIVTLVITQIVLAMISEKNKYFRDFIEGKPVVIIENGRIKDREMKKHRYTLNDLMAQLREKNIANVSDVEIAVLEPSGKLSVFPKVSKHPVTREDLKLELPYEGLAIPLIMDGQVLDKNLARVGMDRFSLKNHVQAHGLNDFKEVFFASMDHQGNIYVDKKGENENPGPAIE